MKKTVQAVFLTLLAAQVLVVGQGADAKKIVADLRAALGGEEKLAALKTIAVEGQVSKVVNENTSAGSDFELAIELPGKYMKREVFANIGGNQLKRRVGFNGSEVIEDMDTPPSMGGNVHIMRAPGPGMVGGTPSPELVARQRAQLLASSRREFARLMVGMTGGTSPEFPVEFVYGGQAEARGLHLRLGTIDHSLVAMVDRKRLQQIIGNLLSNAIKYTDEGYVELSIHADAESALVRVTDTGIGIPAAEQHKLFVPFHRVQEASSASRPGTGLGLAISRRLAQAMGGDVGMRSKVGAGSEFWIRLPLVSASVTVLT